MDLMNVGESEDKKREALHPEDTWNPHTETQLESIMHRTVNPEERLPGIPKWVESSLQLPHSIAQQCQSPVQRLVTLFKEGMELGNEEHGVPLLEKMEIVADRSDIAEPIASANTPMKVHNQTGEVEDSTSTRSCVDVGHSPLEKMIGLEGGELHLQKYEVHVTIEPGALDRPTVIGVEPITDVLPPIDETTNKSCTFTTGLKFSPSGLHFNKPIKITMPHCAKLSDPAAADVILGIHDREWKLHRCTKQPSAPLPACILRESNLDLYIDHFSVLQLLINWWRNHFFLGKKIECTPYVYSLSTRADPYRFVRLCMHDYVPGLAKKYEADLEKHHYQKADYGRQFFLKHCQGDLNISLSEDSTNQTATLEEKISESQFLHLSMNEVTFNLDHIQIDKDIERLPLKIHVTHGNEGLLIRFLASFYGTMQQHQIPPVPSEPFTSQAQQANPESLHPRSNGGTTNIVNNTYITYWRPTPQQVSTLQNDRSKGSKRMYSREEFDELLPKIAHKISDDSRIEDLGRKLGFIIPDMERFRMMNHHSGNVTYNGTLKMLREWNEQTPQNEAEEKLKTALVGAKLTRIAETYFSISPKKPKKV